MLVCGYSTTPSLIYQGGGDFIDHLSSVYMLEATLKYRAGWRDGRAGRILTEEGQRKETHRSNSNQSPLHSISMRSCEEEVAFAEARLLNNAIMREEPTVFCERL